MHLIPELLDDADQLTTEPAAHETSLFGDIPRPIWIAFLSAWGLLFGLFLLFFTTDAPSTLAVVTASFFGLMTLGLPAALGGFSKSSSRPWRRTVTTRNGPLPTGAAAAQILLIPFGAVIGLALFVLLAL
jgi:hypothetical protein